LYDCSAFTGATGLIGAFALGISSSLSSLSRTFFFAGAVLTGAIGFTGAFAGGRFSSLSSLSRTVAFFVGAGFADGTGYFFWTGFSSSDSSESNIESFLFWAGAFLGFAAGLNVSSSSSESSSKVGFEVFAIDALPLF